jgi:hypothetical protein
LVQARGEHVRRDDRVHGSQLLGDALDDGSTRRTTRTRRLHGLQGVQDLAGDETRDFLLRRLRELPGRRGDVVERVGEGGGVRVGVRTRVDDGLGVAVTVDQFVKKHFFEKPGRISHFSFKG